MGLFINYLKRVHLEIIKNDSDKYVAYLKRKGAKIGNNVHMYDTNIDMKYVKHISIGDNVTLSGVTILAHDAAIKKHTGKIKVGNVIIGNNVFIGYGSIILPGAEIADNVICGAGVVIRGGKIDVNSVVIGNPATIVGKTSEFIEKNNSRIENIINSQLSEEGDNKKVYGESENVWYID